MKKSLLILSTLFFGGLGANAQITLTSADVAIPITVIRQANDTMPAGTLSVGSAGISQTWNMTMLASPVVDTLTFVNSAWGPDAASYPTANLAVKQGYQNFYAYAKSNASTLTIVGAAGTTDFGTGPINVKQFSNPGEIIMNFPSTYLATFTNTYYTKTPAFDANLGGSGIDSVRMESGVTKTSLIDAWGTLTTPLGTFNVLRVKETKISHDTTDIMFGGTWNPFPGMPQIQADSTTSYAWWANSVGFPLVSITLDSMSNITQAQWLMATPTAGINEASSSIDMNVYPNPAQTDVTFALDANKVAAVQIYDLTGRLLNVYTVNNDNLKVDVSAFANGVYTYSLIGKNEEIMNRGKFTVVK